MSSLHRVPNLSLSEASVPLTSVSLDQVQDPSSTLTHSHTVSPSPLDPPQGHITFTSALGLRERCKEAGLGSACGLWRQGEVNHGLMLAVWAL